MPARKGLNELVEAKRLLVLQGDLCRTLLRLEGHALRDHLAGLPGVRGMGEPGRPLVSAGVVVAGVVAVRRWRTLRRWAPVAVAGYRCLNRLFAKPG
jgi:hypothetical protein